LNTEALSPADQPPIPLLLADDDPGMRLVLRKLVERSGGFSLLGEAADGADLLNKARELRPKVILLDVEMPGMSGVECADQLQDSAPDTLLVFVTAHEGYMADAFRLYAFDYLLKPFENARALETLRRIKDLLAKLSAREAPAPAKAAHAPLPAAAPAKQPRLLLRHREGVQFLDMQDILLVQREDRATALYTSDGARYVTSDALGDVEARLDPQTFFRCHKSYIVNLSQIESVSPYGRWTYIIRLRGTKQDALITHDKYDELEKRFR